MRISFIGAGKVGVSFGKYLSNNGRNIIYYLSRNVQSAIRASEFVECSYTDDLLVLLKASDSIFITTNDNEIENVTRDIEKLDLNIRGKNFVHMSGAMTSDIFSPLIEKGAYIYSIHPLQTFTDIEKAVLDLNNSYFSIESNCDNKEFINLFKELGNNVFTLSPEQKVKYHLSACIFSNYFVTLMDYGMKMLEEIGIDSKEGLKAMDPLIMATYNNIKEKGAKEALSGPIKRGDTKTVMKHIKEIEGLDLELYKLLGKVTTDRLIENNNKKIFNEIWKG